MSKNAVCYTVIVICLLSAACLAKYSGGTGEPNDPYLIATPNDLNAIGTDPNDWDKHFKMTADVNMAGFTGTQFNMIGVVYPWFTGVFDGNGHSIHRFTYVAESTDNVGLFGSLGSTSAQIKDLTLTDVSVVGQERVAGLVSTLCGSVSNCRIARGTVSGTSIVGGLVGFGHCGMILDSHVIADVNGSGSNVGGLVGYNYVDINRCFTSGNVSGNAIVGGLVGGNYRMAKVSNCYSLSNVKGDHGVGGLLGTTVFPVENSFSAGIVDGNELFGAFVGGGTYTTYTKCFWDTEINPDANGIGDGSDPNVIGLPTVQMQQQGTFADAGWDMVNIWDIGENQTYPFLRTHLPSDINKDDETNFYDLAILAEHWLDDR